MNHWKIMGWALIGAALFVLLVCIVIVSTSRNSSPTQSAFLIGGLLVPLAAQVAFGVFLLRRGDDTPND